MNFFFIFKPPPVESKSIHHIITSRFGRQKFICFVSQTFDSFCLCPLKKKKLRTFIWHTEIFFGTDEWSNQNCVKTFGQPNFCNCVFRLGSNFTRPSQFYAQNYYHLKLILNKIEHFNQGDCKWKMKCILLPYWFHLS